MLLSWLVLLLLLLLLLLQGLVLGLTDCSSWHILWSVCWFWLLSKTAE